jgi:hypothetical protein
MCLFELRQLTIEAIVLDVPDLGPIQDMVEVVVPVNLFSELVDPGDGVGLLRHGRPSG